MIAIPVFLLIMHFVWIYCLPIPKSNIKQSQVFAIEPGMSANQVSSILGKPKLVKVFKTNKKTLEIYVNFLNKKVLRVAIELNDLAIYTHEKGSDKPFIKNEKLISRYLNP